jgi:polyphosphate kinase
VTPVEWPSLRDQLREILDVQLNDRRSAWEMQSDGSYVRRAIQQGDEQRGSQQILIDLALQRQKEAMRLKKRKRKGPPSARRWLG